MPNYNPAYNISKYETIKENTIIYIVNGQWTCEIAKDVYNNKLVLYTPYTKDVRQIDQNATYTDLFPETHYDIRVYDKFKH